MPTYDYECGNCGEKTEIFQKITDDPIKKCPFCGKQKLVRQFGTGAAIVFKGSGFYQTDYRTDSYKKGAESEAKSKDSAAASDSKSASDAKPATPAPSSDKPAKKKPPSKE
jgi:putative FmdB family regulatory protein